MSNSSSKPLNKPAMNKAMLAMAFASGILNSQLPTLAESKATSAKQIMHQIVTNKESSPEDKASALLKLADDYINNPDRALDLNFGRASNTRWRASNGPLREKELLVSWSKRITLGAHNPGAIAHATNDAESMTKKKRSENKALADKALHASLAQLDKATDKFAQLNMYLIASKLLEQAGDSAGASKCNIILEEAFKSCEQGIRKGTREIEGASSVLGTMAYGLIPINLPDREPEKDSKAVKPKVKPFSEIEFKEAESLRLRSVAIADKLGSEDNTRRMAHRNLALWYAEVGKMERAEKEKQVLFQLVGFKSNHVLYAQQGACGLLVWWEQEPAQRTFDCGMG